MWPWDLTRTWENAPPPHTAPIHTHIACHGVGAPTMRQIIP